MHWNFFEIVWAGVCIWTITVWSACTLMSNSSPPKASKASSSLVHFQNLFSTGGQTSSFGGWDNVACCLCLFCVLWGHNMASQGSMRKHNGFYPESIWVALDLRRGGQLPDGMVSGPHWECSRNAKRPPFQGMAVPVSKGRHFHLCGCADHTVQAVAVGKTWLACICNTWRS